MPDDITASAAIERAIRCAVNGAHEQARSWTHIAAELRQQATTPMLDRILGQVKNQLPPEDPATRLTLHDVEVLFCSKHPRTEYEVRPAVRDRRLSRERNWWMHTDDHSTCAD